jgi:probable HAF family extracellular repeat protein
LGGFFSVGIRINDLGQVTGYSSTATGESHAFVYSNGQMIDLNNFIDPALSLTLTDAPDINHKGQIVANSTSFRAFLLTPIPEPSTRSHTLALRCSRRFTRADDRSRYH